MAKKKQASGAKQKQQAKPKQAKPDTTPKETAKTASAPKQSQNDRNAAIAKANRKAQMQTYAVFGGAALIVVGLFAWTFLRQDNPTGVSDPTAWDLPAIETDERIQLADFRGKPVVVNFFASWCDQCDEELPHFASISEEFSDEVTFVGVNSLESGDRMSMPRRHGIDWWPLAKDIDGGDNGLHGALGGGRGLPHTAYYDADGRLVNFTGFQTEVQLRAQVEALAS